MLIFITFSLAMSLYNGKKSKFIYQVYTFRQQPKFEGKHNKKMFGKYSRIQIFNNLFQLNCMRKLTKTVH